MKNNSFFKLIIDILSLTTLFLLFFIKITGNDIHEILGIILILFIVAHLLLNRKWITSLSKNISSKNINSKHKILFILNLILFALFCVSLISGIIISKFIFNFGISNTILLSLHKISSFMLLIVAVLHLGIHFDYIFNISHNFQKEKKVILNISLGICLLIGTVLPIYSLIKGNSNMKGINNNINVNTPSNRDAEGFNNDNSTTNGNRPNNDDSTITDGNSSSGDYEDLLSKLTCIGCGRRCLLSNPQCGKGARQAQQAIEEYGNSTTTSDSSDITY